MLVDLSNAITFSKLFQNTALCNKSYLEAISTNVTAGFYLFSISIFPHSFFILQTIYIVTHQTVKNQLHPSILYKVHYWFVVIRLVSLVYCKAVKFHEFLAS